MEPASSQKVRLNPTRGYNAEPGLKQVKMQTYVRQSVTLTINRRVGNDCICDEVLAVGFPVGRGAGVPRGENDALQLPPLLLYLARPRRQKALVLHHVCMAMKTKLQASCLITSTGARTAGFGMRTGAYV
jgi:hypothetical protein